jgi:hypothetical protein
LQTYVYYDRQTFMTILLVVLSVAALGFAVLLIPAVVLQFLLRRVAPTKPPALSAVRAAEAQGSSQDMGRRPLDARGAAA